MKIYCCCCAKQIVSDNPSKNNPYTTIKQSSRNGVGGDVFCGYCASDLDHNGLFPEDIATLSEEELIVMGYV